MTTASDRRVRLELEKMELLSRLERVRRHHVDMPVSADSSDRAIEQENDEVLERIEESATAQIALIDHAIAHLDRGGGNGCESCGHPIESARLAAVPHATQCRNCINAVAGRMAH